MRRRLVMILLAVTLGTVLHAQSEIHELQQALESARGSERVALLNKIARATQGNAPSESIPYAEEALQLAGSLNDLPGKTNALNNLGIAHYFLGNYDTALGYYRQSLSLAEELGDDELTANALNNIGIIHFVWGEYEETLEYYSRTLEIRQGGDDKKGLASAYNNLGNVYYAAERYDESLTYYAEALVLYDELGNEGLVASTRNNIGLSLLDMGRMDESLEEFETARGIEERIDDKPGLARSLDHIGMVYESWGRHEDSLAHHRRALAVREEIGDRQGMAISLLNIGTTYAELGEHEESRQHLNRALQVATELSLKEVERDIHEGLSRSYEETADFEKALEHYQRFKEVQDQLFDEQTGQRLAELQARYQVEKKDREIEVLRKNQQIQRMVRNAGLAGALLLLVVALLFYNRYRLKERATREILKANEALKLAQEEREKAARGELAHVSRVTTLGELTAALAHELRQPLTAILTNAQAARRLITSDPVDHQEVDEALGDIVDGAGRSREIIQKLRDMLRRGDITREPVDVNDALREIEPFARADAREHGAILSLALEPDLPPVSADRIQLQQVLLNLVHNAAEAMEATSPARREIVLRTSRSDTSTVQVAVRDNGPPIDESVVEHMFDPFYTTKTDGLGMGLPISYTIIEAHGGRLWAARNPDAGLTVQFTLPILGAE